MTKMIVQVGRSSKFDLVFQIDQHPIADLWLKKMSIRHQWVMDNPDRFYGFGSFDDECEKAIGLINQSISTINDYQPLIQRSISDVRDQDTLNYLHNIFEKYHGQLDQQDHEFWRAAPQTVRQALADLNIHVHRCESLRSGKLLPRFVCTWYGMPKNDVLPHYLKEKYSVDRSQFGGVYLNYAEIGKTAQDMAFDNDTYMDEKMFQPFNHYSADFTVEFFDDSEETIENRQKKTFSYFESNRNFFSKFGIESADDIRIKPIKFKIGQLLYEFQDKEYIISQIRKDQWVSSVILK